MPDERRYLQSKFKKKTNNPKFEESYVFQVCFNSIDIDRLLYRLLYRFFRVRFVDIGGMGIVVHHQNYLKFPSSFYSFCGHHQILYC
jgi:hypothetical protein